MYHLTEAEFLHSLILFWRQLGQPDTEKFVTDALVGAHKLSRNNRQKTWREREEEKRQKGMCVHCGIRKPDGVRSQARCTVCLDRGKVSQQKSEAKRCERAGKR